MRRISNNVSHDLVREHLEEQKKKDEQDDSVELVSGPKVTAGPAKVPVTALQPRASRDEDTAVIRSKIYNSVGKSCTAHLFCPDIYCRKGRGEDYQRTASLGYAIEDPRKPGNIHIWLAR
jgi:hypothetical protein